MLAALLMAVSFAAAEEETAEQIPDNREADLFDLWDCGTENAVWLTAAPEISEGVLVTVWALLPQDKEHLTVSDGRNTWDVKAVIPDDSGMLAFIFFQTDSASPRYAPISLLTIGNNVPVSSCTARWGDELRSRINARILSANTTEWNEKRCMLLMLSKRAPLGSVVLNAEGELAGIVVAQYAEGENRVLAVSTDELARCITEVGVKLSNVDSWTNAPEGFNVTLDKNTMTIDWSAMTLPEKADDETLYVVVADSGNSYLSYFAAEVESRSVTILTMPGRVYLSGILASRETPSQLPEDCEITVIPPAQKLTEHHFRPILTAVAEMPADSSDPEAKPVPVTEVNEEMLRSGRAYFYSSSCYEVTETIQDLSLLVTLTDPNGVVYRYESSWIYMPEYMQEDVWFISMKDNGLTSSLDEHGYPKGVYRMAYYVEGELADSFTFEIK